MMTLTIGTRREIWLNHIEGREVETEYGHVLVFGVTPELQQAFDFSNIHLALADVIAACDAHGAVAVPCHPGRKRVGIAAHLERPEGCALSKYSTAAATTTRMACLSAWLMH